MWWTLTATAATLTVGQGQAYPTLGAAVTASASGDTIQIHPGTYDGDVLIQNKDLSLVGVGGPVLATNGQGLRVKGGRTLLVDGVVFDGGNRRADCLLIQWSTVPPTQADPTVRNTVFQHCRTAFDADFASVVLEDSAFVDNGDGLLSNGFDVRVARVEFRDNRFPMNLDVFGLRLTESTFVNNWAFANIAVNDGGNVVARNRFCGNGGGLEVLDINLLSPADSLLIAENLFQENTNTAYGGGLSLMAGATAWDEYYGATPLRVNVVRNTFVGNSATREGSQAFVGGWVQAMFDSNVFVGGSQGVAAVYEDPMVERQVTGVYNLFWDNAPGDLYGITAQEFGVSSADPLWTDVTLDGDCDNDDFTPLPGSPLLDGGNPARPQRDGTPPDLGWTGY